MRFTSKDSSAALAKTPCVAVLALQGKKLELPRGVELPASAADDFSGEFRSVRATDASAGSAARVLLVGLGERDECDAERVRRAAALATRRLEGVGKAKASLWISADAAKACGGAECAGRAMAEGAAMAQYQYQDAKSAKRKRKLTALTLCGPGKTFARGAGHGARRGAANCFTRDLQNAPGNMMRPRDLVTAAKKLAARSAQISCRVLDEKAMKTQKMGSLLSVSRGSEEPAYLVHLTYKPKKKARGKVALVGKGLTFDAGGISLKPAPAMDEMKYDMSGGAAVLGVFAALAEGIDVPQEVHGVVACSENLPDGKANKPGDVVTASNGLTIEVLNTDAEGRLILADALVYTDRKIKPDTVIDLATLTGAVITALGHELSGMFASSERLRDSLTAAGESVGEKVWPLPLLDLHKDQMKGTVADLRNINMRSHGNGSTSGAAFLCNFAGEREWAHLDIAGTAWGTMDRDWVGGPQGSGVGTRLLLQYLEDRD